MSSCLVELLDELMSHSLLNIGESRESITKGKRKRTNNKDFLFLLLNRDKKKRLNLNDRISDTLTPFHWHELMDKNKIYTVMRITFVE